MPPCKGHKKSRTGCLQCKQRRVKCNETRPRCSNCAKRNGSEVQCIYLNPSGTSDPDMEDAVSSASVNGSSIANPETAFNSNFTVWELTTSPHPLTSTGSPQQPRNSNSQQQCVCGRTHSYPPQTAFPGKFASLLPPCTLTRLVSPDADRNPPSAFLATASYSLTPSSEYPSNSNTINIGLFSHLHIPPLDKILLQNFISSTSRTLTQGYREDLQKFWSYVVLGMGETYPFVLHSVLAVSAAQMAFDLDPASTSEASRPDTTTVAVRIEELRWIAETHFVKAMQDMEPHLLERQTDANCHALFAAMTLCNIYLSNPYRHRFNFTSTRLDTNPNVSSQQFHSNSNSFGASASLDTTWTSFLRGRAGMMVNCWSWISRGPTTPIFSTYQIMPQTPRQLSKNTEAMFVKLNRLVSDFTLPGAARELGEDFTSASAYFKALWNLRLVWGVFEDCLGFSECNDKDEGSTTAAQDPDYPPTERGRMIKHPDALNSAMFQFVIRTPTKFWDCLERRRPRALIIYAYLSICWVGLSGVFHPDAGNANSGRWWTEGRADIDLKRVQEELSVHGAESTMMVEGNGIWMEWIQEAYMVLDALKWSWWLDSGYATSGHQVMTRDSVGPDNVGSTEAVTLSLNDNFSQFLDSSVM